MTSTDSATINWHGEVNNSGSIDYAKTSYFDAHHSFESKAETTKVATYQHVRLSGLYSNTSYTYRVTPSGSGDPFANRSFRTMPESGPFTFIVFSDPQKGNEYEEKQRFKYVADAI
jgi:phosphodiesterase/alkaline phosphatase D-like protein